MNVAALVLAAGGSKRLGQPKQLLRFAGQTLVRRTVETALAAGCSRVCVVVGREHAAIAAEVKELAEILPNEQWERGLGTSIRAGLAALSEVEAVIILACDQPHVSAALLRELISAWALTKKTMAASRYAGTIGVPAIFARDRFAELLSLGDRDGAKAILLAHPGEVATVDFPRGAIDIDTPADLAALGA